MRINSWTDVNDLYVVLHVSIRKEVSFGIVIRLLHIYGV